MSSVMARSRSLPSATMKREKCVPMTSRASKPWMNAAPAFQLVTSPSGSSM
jgi:hypothetical protein